MNGGTCFKLSAPGLSKLNIWLEGLPQAAIRLFVLKEYFRS